MNKIIISILTISEYIQPSNYTAIIAFFAYVIMLIKTKGDNLYQWKLLF